MTDAANVGGASSRTSAPWHVWVLGGLVALWGAFGAFDFTATVTHFAPYMSNFSEDMVAYWYAMPLWMFVVWGIAVWGGLLGAILVLVRSKLAVPVLAASLLAIVVSMAVSFMRPAPEAQGIVLPIIVIAIAALFLVYAWWMARRGVLR